LEQASLLAPEGEAARKLLRARAEVLVKEADGLADDAALAKLDEALRLWPQLPGLRDSVLNRRNAYSILYVGVRRLPELFSPATAWTDAEKQAVELLFEGLVQPVHTKANEHFEARLAARLPLAPDRATPGWERTFALRRDAYFSDGQRVSSVDVRHTVLLLSDPQRPGRAPAWSDIVEVPRVEGGSFNVPLHLRQRSIE